MKKLFFIFCFLFQGLNSWAQVDTTIRLQMSWPEEDSEVVKSRQILKYFFAAKLGPTIRVASMRNIEDFLEINGYNYSPSIITFPIDFSFEMPLKMRFCLGFEYGLGISEPMNRFKAYNLGLEHNFARSKNSLFMLGVAWEFMQSNLSFTEKATNQVVSINDLLTTKFLIHPNLYNYGGAINFNSSIHTLYPHPSISCSVSVGYSLYLRPQTWTASNVILMDAPSDRISTLYIKFGLMLFKEKW